jgi:bifunctional non-homologous end joining protein LigD
MLFEEAPRPFSDPAWTFEIKFDGYRVLAASDETGVKMKSRNGADAAPWFPEVAESLRSVASRRIILDGEVCVLDELGRSDFNRLQARARRRRFLAAEPVVFCVFDVLAVGGASVMERPLHERKTNLSALRLLPHILVVDDIPEHGELFYRHAVALELEGLVAKRLASTYQPGIRSKDWLKIKRPGAIPAARFRR